MQPEAEAMDCAAFLERYSEYDDSLAAAEAEAELRRHLELCGSCARYDRVLRKGRMLARQLPAPAPAPDFLPRLELRLESERDSWRAPNHRLAGALSLVTLLVVVSATVLLLDARPRTDAAQHGSHVAGFETAETHAPATPAATLPWVAWAGADWSERVDRRVSPSYSPLITGPPAYRVARAPEPSSPSTSRRTLD